MRFDVVPVFMEYWMQYLEDCVVDEAMDRMERKLDRGECQNSPEDGDRLVRRGL